MGREKEFYRENVQILIEEGFPSTATGEFTAKYLGVTRQTLDRWRKDGLIRRTGTRYSREDVARYKCGIR